jgi:hypothetical protein
MLMIFTDLGCYVRFGFAFGRKGCVRVMMTLLELNQFRTENVVAEN